MKELIEEIIGQTEGLVKELLWDWMFSNIQIRDFELKFDTANQIIYDLKEVLRKLDWTEVIPLREKAFLAYQLLSETTELPSLKDLYVKIDTINEVYEEDSFAGEVEDFSNIYNYVVKEESL